MSEDTIGGLSPAEIERRWHAQIAENARLRQELAAANQASAEAVERCKLAEGEREKSRAMLMKIRLAVKPYAADAHLTGLGAYDACWRVHKWIDAALQPDPKPAQGE